MAFFGSDGSENQVRQLKHQLGQKDAQIQTYMQELEKKDELSQELKRAKEEAVYKAALEADRAVKASASLVAKSKEFENTMMRMSNLESILATTQEHTKQQDKEIRRLQFELDSRSQTGESTNRMAEINASLEAQVKSLQSDIQRVQSAKESLQAELDAASSGGLLGGMSQSGGGERTKILNLENQIEGLRKENVRLMEEARKTLTSASPRQSRSALQSDAPSSRRRRTMSVTTDDRVNSLEQEIEHLRAQLGSDTHLHEFETMKRNLDAAKREALKLVNEKMALERSSQKDLAEMRSKLEDLAEELDDARRYASDGESVAKLEQLKKESNAERQALEGKIESLQKEVERYAQQTQRLEALSADLVAQLEDKTAELEALQSMPSSPSSGDRIAPAEVDRYRAEIASLTERLSTAESQQASASTPVDPSSESLAANRKIRSMEREIAALKRDKSALEDNLLENDEALAEKEQKILRLKRSVPLPPSRPGTPVHSATESELDELETTVRALQGVNAELREAIAQRDATIKQLQAMEAQWKDAVLQAEAEVQSASAKSEVQLAELQATLSQAESDLARHRSDLSAAQAQIGAMQTYWQTAEAELQNTIRDLQEQLAVAQTQSLAASTSIASELANAKAELSHHRAARSGLESAQKTLQDDLAALQAAAVDAAAEKEALYGDFKQLEQAMMEAQNSWTAERAATHAQARDAAAQLTAQRERAQGLEQQISVAQEQLLAATEDSLNLKERIDELESQIANRTSESDVRLREETAFDLQEQVEELRKELQTAQFEAEQARADEQELARRLSDSEKKLADLVETHDQAQQSLQDQTWRIAELEGHAKSVIAELGQRMADISDLTDRLAESEQQVRLAENKQKAYNSQISEYKRLLQFADLEYQCIVTTSKEQEDRLEQSHTALKDTRLSLTEMQAELAAAKALQISERTQTDVQADSLKDRVSVLEIAVADTEEALRISESRLSHAQTELASTTQELATAAAARNSLTLQVASFGVPANELVAQLQGKVQELEGRVDRRSQTLLNVMREKEKLQTNLALAEETLHEQEEQITRAQHELATVETDVSDKEARLAAALTSLAQTESALSIESSTAAALRLDNETSQVEIAALVAEVFRGGLTIRQQRAQYVVLQQRLQRAATTIEAAASGRDLAEAALQDQAELLSATQAELQAQSEIARKDAEDTLTRLAEASQQRRALEQDLQARVEEIARLTKQLGEAQEQLASASQAIEERSAADSGRFDDAMKAMESMMQTLAKVETDLSSKEEEVDRLSADLARSDALCAELKAEMQTTQVAQEALTVEHADCGARLQRTEQGLLDQAREHLKQLETARGEVEELRVLIASRAIEQDALQKQHEREIELSAAELDRTATLLQQAEAASVAKDGRLEDLVARSKHLEGEIAQLRNVLAVAEADQETTLRATAEHEREHARLQNALAEAQEELAGVKRTLLQAEQRSQAAQSSLAEALSASERLREASEQAQRTLKEVLADRNSLASRLDANQADLKRIRHNEVILLARVAEVEKQVEQAAASAAPSAELLDELAELRETRQRLESQCNAYVQEQDVLDDQLKEANRILALEKRKREKLERKLKLAEAGAAASSAAPSANKSSTGSSDARVTLAPITSATNNAENMQTAQRTPSGAFKRGRDEADIKPAKSAEAQAIIAPASYDAAPARTPGTPRSRGRQFTPQRHANRPRKLEDDQNLPPVPTATVSEMVGKSEPVVNSLNAFKDRLAHMRDARAGGVSPLGNARSVTH